MVIETKAMQNVALSTCREEVGGYRTIFRHTILEVTTTRVGGT